MSLPAPFTNSLSLGTLGSLILHVVVFGALTSTMVEDAPPSRRPDSIKVKIQETPPPPPTPAKVEKKIPPKPPKALAKTTNPPKADPNTPPPQPVYGVAKESLQPAGSGGIAVPVGNTTMMADDGKRMRPEDIQKLDRDYSADAKLLLDSLKLPQYTDAAVEANLEGRFVVEIFVDDNGKVGDVQLKKKIGYDMDGPVIEAIRKAQFSPRRNPVGVPIAGWTEITIRLELD